MKNSFINCRSALVVVVALMLAGCGKTDDVPASGYMVPEVSDLNCGKAAIEAMPIPDGERREFGSKCARRGSYTPSAKKVW